MSYLNMFRGALGQKLEIVSISQYCKIGYRKNFAIAVQNTYYFYFRYGKGTVADRSGQEGAKAKEV